MEQDREMVEKEIVDFLNKMSSQKGKVGEGCGLKHGSALVLATCKNNEPRATTLDFFNEGLTLYIFGEPGGKIGNIRANPNVSASIYQQPMDHSFEQKSIQLWGRATLIHRKDSEQEFMAKVDKWGLREVAKALISPQVESGKIPKDQLDAALDKTLSSLNIIKIEPEKIILRVYKTDFSMPKYTWTKEG